MPREKSPIWKFFVKTKTGGMCKLCNNEIKSPGTTTNLFKHIQRKHPKVKATEIKKKNEKDEEMEIETQDEESLDSEISISSKSSFSQSETISIAETETISKPSTSKSSYSRQPLITEAVTAVKSFQDGGTKSNQIANAIVYMIVKDNLTLNTTDKEGFQFLMKTVAPLYKIPGRKSVTKMIDEKYDILQKIIKNKMSEVLFMTLTTDIWTDTINTKSFLGITSHFFLNGKLHSITLDVLDMDKGHTAEYISACLKVLFNKWGILTDRITAIVTDNGKNIVKSVGDTVGKNKHLPCFAHTLDLVASKVTYENEVIKPLLEKVKKIVTYFKQSVNAADELRRAQPQENILKLKQSVPTRWNSCYYMLERFIALHKYVVPILLNYPKAPEIVSASDVEEIKEFIEVLKPIESVSKELSGERYITSSKIIPLVNCLNKGIEQLKPATKLGQDLRQLTLSELTKRFGAIEHNKILAVSTVLDPRFRKLHFNNPEAYSQVINFINKGLTQTPQPQKEQQTQETVKTDRVGLWSLHETLVEDFQKKKSNERDTSGELSYDLKFYLHGPLLQLSKSPFEYWVLSNSPINLQNMAIQYLSVVGSSVACERIFSKAGNIMTEARNRLDPKRLGKLLFLNSLNYEDWHV